MSTTRQLDVLEDRWEGKNNCNKNNFNNEHTAIADENNKTNTSSARTINLEEGITRNTSYKCKSQVELHSTNTKEQNELLTTSTRNTRKRTRQHFSPLKRHILQQRTQKALHFLHTVQHNLCVLEQSIREQQQNHQKQYEETEQELRQRKQEKTCCCKCEQKQESLESYQECQNDSSASKKHIETKENIHNSNDTNSSGEINKLAAVDVVSDDCDGSKSTNTETSQCSSCVIEEIVQHGQNDLCDADEVTSEEEEKNTITSIGGKNNTTFDTKMSQIHLSPPSLLYLLSVNGRQHIAKVKRLCTKLEKAINTQYEYYQIKLLQTSLQRSYDTLLRKAAIHTSHSLQENEENYEEKINKLEKEEEKENTLRKTTVENTELEEYPLDTMCIMEQDNRVAENNAEPIATGTKTRQGSGDAFICENAFLHDECNNNKKMHKCNVKVSTITIMAKSSMCDAENSYIDNDKMLNQKKENEKEKQYIHEMQQQNKLVRTTDVRDKDCNNAKEIESSRHNWLCVHNIHKTTIHPLSHIIDQRNETFKTIRNFNSSSDSSTFSNNIDSCNVNIAKNNNKPNQYPRTLSESEVRYILSQCDKLQEMNLNETNNALQQHNSSKTQQEDVNEESNIYEIYRNIGIHPLFANSIHSDTDDDICCQDKTHKTNNDPTNKLHQHKLQKGQLQVMYYCRNMITTTLDDIAFTLLQALFKEQRELKRKRPLQFKAHQRYVVGLNETLKFLRSGRIKCVILAADIEVETEEVIKDATNANHVDDDTTMECNEASSTTADENENHIENNRVNNDTCFNNYETTTLPPETHATISNEKKAASTSALPEKPNWNIAKASTTRKRFQSLRSALTELATLCAGNKTIMSVNNNDVNTDSSNNTWNGNEGNKCVQSRRQRRHAKQHNTSNNTTDKQENNIIITHSVECVTQFIDVEKYNQSKLYNSATTCNSKVIPCITCMSRQRLAYALFAKNSSIACVGVIKAEKNHELLKALMSYGHVLQQYYDELMHRYDITT